MKEIVIPGMPMAEAMDSCFELIAVYASTLSKFAKENGYGSIETITDGVIALAQLMEEVNDLRY